MHPGPVGRGSAGIKVFIVDDHPLVRRGLAQMLALEKDMSVCGESDNAPEAFRMIGERVPSVVTIDLSLRESSGMELVKNLHEYDPRLPLVVLSMHDESYYAERALRSGASAYVMKDEPPETLVQAIRQVVAGRLFVSPRMSTKMLSKVAGRPDAEGGLDVDALSDRELEVFERIGNGQGTRQIAGELNISHKTVEAHRDHIRRKLKLVDGNELVHYAVRWWLQRHPA